MPADANRLALLRRIQELEFVGVDLTLYLDTHPEDVRALEQYNKAAKELKTLQDQYMECYGPLCAYGMAPVSDKTWRWIDDPWPWEM